MYNMDKITELNKNIRQMMGELKHEYGCLYGYLISKSDAEEAYKKGLDEAWEALKKLYAGYKQGEIKEIFGINAGPKDWEPNILSIVFRDFTASEALAKLRDYEARQKAEDEAVKVGDEVYDFEHNRLFVVVRIIENEKRCAGITRDGKFISTYMNMSEKTGRHFPEIAAVLEQMKGE